MKHVYVEIRGTDLNVSATMLEIVAMQIRDAHQQWIEGNSRQHWYELKNHMSGASFRFDMASVKQIWIVPRSISEYFSDEIVGWYFRPTMGNNS